MKGRRARGAAERMLHVHVRVAGGDGELGTGHETTDVTMEYSYASSIVSYEEQDRNA